MEVDTITRVKMTYEEICKTIFYDDFGNSYKAENVLVGKNYGITTMKKQGCFDPPVRLRSETEQRTPAK